MGIILSKLPELKTAEEDIVCYKEVKKLRSYRHGFLWLKKSTLYRSQYKGKLYESNKIYNSPLDIPESIIWTCGKDRYRTGSGFYSWKNRNHPLNIPNVVCIIPKGSIYYEVMDSDWSTVYISNQIKIVEEL